MPPTLRQVVTQRAGGCCEYCHYPQSVMSGVLHLDHIIPPKFGGTNTADNCALSCQQCNSKKSDKINGIDPATGQIERLFNPRRDNWNEHFYLDPNTGVITGLTLIGRVTIKELGINEPEQIATRLRLLNAHLF